MADQQFTQTVLANAVMVALLVSLIGCERQASVTTPVPPATPTKPVAPKPPPAVVVSAAQRAGTKLQGYIECFNEIDSGAHRSIARYASWVKDMKLGPSGKESVVHGLYALESQKIAQCANTFPQTARLRPSMATLDTAAEIYIKVLTGMDKQVQAAHSYYDRQNYKDDKLTQGRVLHGPLAASFDAFMEASQSFSEALDVENDLVLTAKLSELEKIDGRKLPYFKMAVMNRAKLLSNTLGEEKFEVTKAGEQMVAFETILDEGLSYTLSHPGEKPANWSDFAGATQTFRHAAKERLRRMRDKVPYNEGEQKLLALNGAQVTVEGSADKLIQTYNGLVAAGNNLDQ
jgi:hypothetical protein